MAITEKFVGQSVLRKEDASPPDGAGSFVDNLTLPACSTWRSSGARSRTHAS